MKEVDDEWRSDIRSGTIIWRLLFTCVTQVFAFCIWSFCFQEDSGHMGCQSTANSSWYALRVRTKCEKVVVGGLRQREILNFLPLYETRTQWSDRIKTNSLPLFPGYVFARLDGQQLHRLYSVPAFMYIVGRGSVPEPVDESDIDAVKCLVAKGKGVGPWPFCAAGQLVDVIRGPLAGIQGVYLRAKGHDRLVISIPMLQRSVATEIESFNVRPVSGAFQSLGAA